MRSMIPTVTGHGNIHRVAISVFLRVTAGMRHKAPILKAAEEPRKHEVQPQQEMPPAVVSRYIPSPRIRKMNNYLPIHTHVIKKIAHSLCLMTRCTKCDRIERDNNPNDKHSRCLRAALAKIMVNTQ